MPVTGVAPGLADLIGFRGDGGEGLGGVGRVEQGVDGGAGGAGEMGGRGAGDDLVATGSPAVSGSGENGGT
jgi:hypothetical protein